MMRPRLAVLAALLAATPASAADRLTPHTTDEAVRALMRQNQAAAVTHNGTVMEVHHTDNYVFIRAEQAGSHTWLAAARQEVPVGVGLRWGEGVEMHDFMSKQLNRFFHEIVFVDRIELVK